MNLPEVKANGDLIAPKLTEQDWLKKNNRGNTRLHTAILAGESLPELTQKMLMATDSRGYSVAHLALEKEIRIFGLTKAMLTKVEQWGFAPIHTVLRLPCRIQLVRELLDEKVLSTRTAQGISATFIAATHGSMEAISMHVTKKMILEKDELGRTNAAHALCYGKNHIDNILTNKEIKEHVTPEMFTARNGSGYTLLHRAARLGNLTDFNWTLPMLQIRDNLGYTPVSEAAYWGNIDLLRNKIQPEQLKPLLVLKDNMGQTCIHKLAEGGHLKDIADLLNVEMLIEKDNMGQCPIEIAYQTQAESEIPLGCKLPEHVRKWLPAEWWEANALEIEIQEKHKAKLAVENTGIQDIDLF